MFLSNLPRKTTLPESYLLLALLAVLCLLNSAHGRSVFLKQLGDDGNVDLKFIDQAIAPDGSLYYLVESGGVDVTEPGDPVVQIGDDGSRPEFGAKHAIDDITHKYLNNTGEGAGLIVTPRVAATVVNGLRIYVGNNDPRRDPTSYSIEGSKVGPDGPWKPIASGFLESPIARNPDTDKDPITTALHHFTVGFDNATPYKSYRVIFPTIRVFDSGTMQIAELELLRGPAIDGLDSPVLLPARTYLVKVNKLGQIRWARAFRGKTSVEFNSIAVNDDHIILGGSYQLNDPNDKRIIWGYPLRSRSVFLTGRLGEDQGLIVKLNRKRAGEDEESEGLYLDHTDLVGDALNTSDGPAVTRTRVECAITAVGINASGQVGAGGYYKPYNEISEDIAEGIKIDRDHVLRIPNDLDYVYGGTRLQNRRVPFIASFFSQSGDEWVSQLTTEELQGMTVAQVEANRQHQSHIRKIVVTNRGDTFFAGRFSGGRWDEADEGEQPLLIGSPLLTTDTASHYPPVELVQTGNHSAWNTFMIGRIDSTGDLTGINYDNGDEVESFASDMIITDSGVGYIVGGVRSLPSETNVGWLQTNVHLEEVEWIHNFKNTLRNAGDHTYGIVAKFAANNPNNLNITDWSFLAGDSKLEDGIECKGVSLAADSASNIYMVGAVESGTVSHFLHTRPAEDEDKALERDETELEVGLNGSGDGNATHFLLKLRSGAKFAGAQKLPAGPSSMAYGNRTDHGDISHSTSIESRLAVIESNLLQRRLYWTGGFKNDLSFAGENASDATTVSSNAWKPYLTAFDLGADEDNLLFVNFVTLLLQAPRFAGNLTFEGVAANYTPENFIQPALGVEHQLLSGEVVKVKIPYRIYGDIPRVSGTLAKDPNAETSLRVFEVLANREDERASVGKRSDNTISRRRYTLNNYEIVQIGDADSVREFEFTIEGDTTFNIDYSLEHRLDTVAIVNQESKANELLSEDALRIQGNPTYSVNAGETLNLSVGTGVPGKNRHTDWKWSETWIPDGADVSIKIGENDGFSSVATFGERFVIDSYKGGASTQIVAKNFTHTNESDATKPIGIDSFSMKDADEFEIKWNKQVHVRLGPLSKQAARSEVFVASGPNGGTDFSDVETDPFKAASELESADPLWFDYGTHIAIGAAAEFKAKKDGTIAATNTPESEKKVFKLDGWLSAGGHFPFNTADQSRFEGIDDAPDPDPNVSHGSGKISKEGVVTLNTSAPDSHWLEIKSLTKPTFVVWNYGDKIIEITRAIGGYVELEGVTDIFDSVEVITGPAGTDATNGVAWDKVEKRLFPLRPGRYFARFPGDVFLELTTGFPGGKLADIFEEDDLTEEEKAARFALLGTDWSGDYKKAHYRHIAGASPVHLDSDPEDGFAYKDFAYFHNAAESAGDLSLGAEEARVEDGQFTNGLAGKSVLLFSRSHYVENTDGSLGPDFEPGGGSSFPADGNLDEEPLFVRVVETRRGDLESTPGWTTGNLVVKASIAPAIGRPIRNDEFDTAGLETGWTVFDSPKLLINPDIYNRDAVSGPIIPINRRLPGTVVEFRDELVITWYENYGEANPGQEPGIDWPYQPVRYPSTEYGIPGQLDERFTGFPGDKRKSFPPVSTTNAGILYTSSRLGSDGLRFISDNGEGWARQKIEVGEGDFVESVSLSSELIQDVKVYHQPDKDVQGYNPNEEHAFVAPAVYAHGSGVFKVASTDDDTFTGAAGSRFSDGDVIILELQGDDTLPEPLVTGTPYYVQFVANKDQTFQLFSDAARKTLVEISDVGSGEVRYFSPGNVVAKTGGSQGMSVYALRDDLNVGAREWFDKADVEGRATFNYDTGADRSTYTSEPMVLVQYFDTLLGEHRMTTYFVDHESDIYQFRYDVTAGTPIRAPYPVDTVLGFSNFNDSYQNDNHADLIASGDVRPVRIDGTYYLNGYKGSEQTKDRRQAGYWLDSIGNAWAISGPLDSPDTPHVFAGFFYPLLEDFWFPQNEDGEPQKSFGDPVSWLPGLKNSNDKPDPVIPALSKGDNAPDGVPTAIRYDTRWPNNIPVLKIGETLTHPGGEYKADNPQTLNPETGQFDETKGLPGVIAWQAGQVLFDSITPSMREADMTRKYTARLADVVNKLQVSLVGADVRNDIPNAEDKFQIDASGKIVNDRGNWRFSKLSASLQKRVHFDPILQQLVLQGYVSNRPAGPQLTATPDPVYVVEPTILTLRDATELRDLFSDSPTWKTAVAHLYAKSRDPKNITKHEKDDSLNDLPGQERLYLAGMDSLENTEEDYESLYFDGNGRVPAASFGTGLALVPSPNLMDPAQGFENGYVTLVENAHPERPGLGPITIHIVRLDKKHRYRGAIKTIASTNVFDEKIVLKHAGDFGANIDDLRYEWWYLSALPGDVGTPDFETPLSRGKWKQISNAQTNEIILQGDPKLLLGDMLFFTRFRHKDEPSDQNGPRTPTKHWSDPEFFVETTNDRGETVETRLWNWAGAGNSPQVQADGTRKFLPQLVMGWVKRVLDRVNPYEARFSDFYNNDSPATYSSMIQQAGPPPRGAVALNPDKNVIENVGLIELYKTILDRAEALSIGPEEGVGNHAIFQALLLAATRINQLYMVLGNEAYADAQDPTIGLWGDDLAPVAFAFQNQEHSLLTEELALLRGTDFGKGWPVENRLFWNFVKGQGEVAYATNYNIKDVNGELGTPDGFIDERDAMRLFPQGHGDAWGQYLSASRAHYTLLRHPRFSWPTFAELYNLLDIVIETDFIDEVTFARTAAAKARAGAEIVKNTYRQKYEQDPDGQWHGYEDTDPARSWGVSEWGTRAYQGAYFDWMVGNALMPYDESFKRVITSTEGGIDTFAFDFAVEENFHLRVFLAGEEQAQGTDYTIPVEGSVQFSKAPPSGSRIQIDNGNGIDDSANQLGQIERISVGELPEIAVYASEIQNTIDEANNGINPLGVSSDAVTFDINPARLDRNLGAPSTHFEQVYERAVKAGQNALVTFDYANRLENRLRSVADRTDKTRRKAEDQDRSFRNRLISVFGTPYDGLIGPGGLYPPGYEGPDLLLYRYIDYNAADGDNGFVPGVSQTFKELFKYESSPYEGLQGLRSDTRTLLRNSIGLDENYQLGSIIKTFTKLDVSDDPDLEDNPFYDRFEAGTDFTIRDSNGELISFNVPISSDAVHGFRAEPNWLKRRATGKIQQKLQELVQAQIDLKKSLDDYEGYLRVLKGNIHAQQAGFKGFARSMQQEIAIRTLRETTDLIILAFETVAAFKNKAAKQVFKVANANQKLTDITITLAGGNTASKGTQAALELAIRNQEEVVKVNEDALAAATKLADIGFAVEKDIFELAQMANSFKGAQRQFVLDLLDDLSGESTIRFEIGTALNSIVRRQQELDSIIAEGFRIAAEREQSNQRLAADTQQNRYSDALLRINHNDALQRYHGALDLAARYAYQAAKAYDYETNLDPSDAASPQPLLTQLVRARTLGMWSSGQPRIGQGGLAEILAKLKANYETLNGQLGFNNPQRETGRFSLRSEWARIKPAQSSDNGWRKVLQRHRVPNLWDVPEFQQYCRPFAEPGAGEQPGIVIPLSTEIMEGKNFFGHVLGVGDESYDSTQFATKVRSVGVWFTGYNDLRDLAGAPRIYLVPAGDDIMLVPDSPNLQQRRWTVIDQKIPVPYPVGDSDLRNPNWLVSADSLAGSPAEIRKFSRFRAYHDNGDFVDEDELTWDSRLVGRSVWNTKWVLIIPGSTLAADAKTGLDRFVGSEDRPGVSDIKLLFQTYSHSGN